MSVGALQDPAASLRRQITPAREWLPPGWHITACFWDVESGGLDLEQRGHGTGYETFTRHGIPRDGGLAGLRTWPSDTSQDDDADLLDELPELAGRLADLPPRLQALLFAAFDIQIPRNPPMRQATIHATITDTTPGIVAALLARSGLMGALRVRRREGRRAGAR